MLGRCLPVAPASCSVPNRSKGLAGGKDSCVHGGRLESAKACRFESISGGRFGSLGVAGLGVESVAGLMRLSRFIPWAVDRRSRRRPPRLHCGSLRPWSWPRSGRRRSFRGNARGANLATPLGLHPPACRLSDIKGKSKSAYPSASCLRPAGYAGGLGRASMPARSDSARCLS